MALDRIDDRCVSSRSHNYINLGPFYTKDNNARYGYTTLYCSKCGATKEVMAIDRGEKFIGDHAISDEKDPVEAVEAVEDTDSGSNIM
jgi:hypothetical protein